MAGRVEGKVALVTGGALGIGRATTLTFAADMEESVITSRAHTCYDRGTQTVADSLPNQSRTVSTGCLRDSPSFPGTFVAS